MNDQASPSQSAVSAPLQKALAVLSKALFLTCVHLILIEVIVGLILSTHWGAILIASIATAILVLAQVGILSFIARDGSRLVMGIMGGYLVKILVVFAAVVGASQLGLDKAFVGISVLATVFVVMVVETVILSKARIPHVDSPRDPQP